MPENPRIGVVYADTSALAKLVINEPESAALAHELEQWADVVTSDLGVIEARRAVMRARDDQRAGVADDQKVAIVLDGLLQLPIDHEVVRLASELQPPLLRTLDAIHVAIALTLGEDLGAIATYDDRMAEAARLLGVQVIRPR